MKQIAFLLQPKNKRGTDDTKTSLKVPNAKTRIRKTKQIAALFRKGDTNGNKKNDKQGNERRS